MLIKYNLNYKQDKKSYALEFILSLLIDSLVLLMASTIFKSFYISSFWYAVLASLIIILLNKTIKPLLIFLTLPVTILTVGLFYPFVNVIILKLTSLIIGSNFRLEGILIPFFIAIFISIMNIFLDALIVKPLTKEKR